MDPATNQDGWYSDAAATFGDRVAAAREAQHMTEEDLARRLGVKVKTVRAWEQDVSEPRANKLQMLAGVLNVSFRWLLTGEGQGVDAPMDGVAPEMAEVLGEMRVVRAEMLRALERMGVLEKRLRSAFEAAS